ncbi:MAG: glycosyltransferase family 4 protein [Candidatus Sulfotelmatobacter sp.]
MKRRLTLLTEIIAPYRIPVFNALASRDDIDLHVIFLSETDPGLRQWQIYKNEIQFSYEILPAWRRRVGKYNLLVNRGVCAALVRSQPQAILCGGYNYVASWQAVRWANGRNIPVLLWSESTANDFRRQRLPVEFMKSRFLRRCRAFVVAGQSSRDYLIHLGASAESIFIAPNAVDINFYASLAARAREQATEVRARYALPPRYFLYAGRLVREKGVFDLLAAYAKLELHDRSQIGLVFAGDGRAHSQLAGSAATIQPGHVHFCGFLQREHLAELYALAEALVFPTHSDPWGLVVNEAMACGLPIIASHVAGCVPDLVKNAENGFVVPPGNIEALAHAMRTMLNDPLTLEKFAAASAAKIQAHSPQACAEGMAKAALFACDGQEFVAAKV